MPKPDQRDLRELCKLVFKTQPGQDLLEVLDLMYQQRGSFVPGDPYQTAFREGQRDIVRLLKNETEA